MLLVICLLTRQLDTDGFNDSSAHPSHCLFFSWACFYHLICISLPYHVCAEWVFFLILLSSGFRGFDFSEPLPRLFLWKPIRPHRYVTINSLGAIEHKTTLFFLLRLMVPYGVIIGSCAFECCLVRLRPALLLGIYTVSNRFIKIYPQCPKAFATGELT